MTKIEIICPSCSKKGTIDLALDLLEKSARGIVAINLGEKQICPHSFVAYIDRNLQVRDCFITDFQIELPEMETEKLHDGEVPDSDVIDVDLIKMDITALNLTYMLHCALVNEKLLLLIDEKFLHDHLMNLFKFIFKDSYDIDISIQESEIYKEDKKKYKGFLVLSKNEIISDKTKVIKPKKIKIERVIVKNFLGEAEPRLSLLFLKNEILKSFKISEEIMGLIESYDGEDKLGKKKLMDMLMKKTNIKITFDYLNFILDILDTHFNFDLSIISDYFFPDLGL
jgi:hypothetical protein